jgi:hypothetical protein
MILQGRFLSFLFLMYWGLNSGPLELARQVLFHLNHAGSPRVVFLNKIQKNWIETTIWLTFVYQNAWLKNERHAGCWWFMPIILGTQEVDIRRIAVWHQPGQTVPETVSRKKNNPSLKRASGVAQGVGPEFKPQYSKKKKERLPRGVVHACNPSYLGGWHWENCGSRPAQANSSWDPISKITRAKWTGGVAQAV